MLVLARSYVLAQGGDRTLITQVEQACVTTRMRIHRLSNVRVRLRQPYKDSVEIKGGQQCSRLCEVLALQPFH